ncbi:MAG: undecaprenyl-phosphate glucose phosphotransferase, partial [Bacteroidota bacterium]
MSLKKSDLIIPISIVIHLGILNLVLYNFTPDTYLQPFAIPYYNASWLVIALSLDFYPTRRNEQFFTNLTKMVYMYLTYGLAYFASFGFMENLQGISMRYQLFVFSIICILFFGYRVLFYMARRKYRLEGGNFVNVVVVGRDKNLKKIRRVFDDPYLGYRYKGFFDDKASKSATYLGNIVDCFGYI